MLTLDTLSSRTSRDALSVVNECTRGWPYSRPLDAGLLEHWAGMGDAFQPENTLLAYRDGKPVAYLHGQASQGELNIHHWSIVPGEMDAGVWLLGEAERRARAGGAGLMRSPCYRAGAFYGGYICGRESYLPICAVECNEALVRAGFTITHTAVILQMDPRDCPASFPLAEGYASAKMAVEPEFGAVTFGFAALSAGKQVAHCCARYYPGFPAPSGGVTGQVGGVWTDDSHRNRGLASVLTQMVLAGLRDAGVTLALIATGLDNGSALRVYEKLGFRRAHGILEWSRVLQR